MSWFADNSDYFPASFGFLSVVDSSTEVLKVKALVQGLHRRLLIVNTREVEDLAPAACVATVTDTVNDLWSSTATEQSLRAQYVL